MKAKQNKSNQIAARSGNTEVTEQLFKTATLQQVNTGLIEFSPMNYRKHLDQQALDQFAAEISLHGVLSPLLVRYKSDGGFQLVAGERRLRAAQIAGLKTVPVLAAQLSDELVREVQLAENLQRENPHPLHEAHAILLMQQTGKSIDEIAARLGKSRKFVYTRLKLSGLIEPMQQILMAEKMSVQQAYEVAMLSEPTQLEIFDQYCQQWEQEGFKMPSGYQISRFRCDLSIAPFDINDQQLITEKGACTSCPLNSATLNSLFPELSKQAMCSGWECYQHKSRTHFSNRIALITESFQPQAIVYSNSAHFESLSGLLGHFEKLSQLPQYSKWAIRELLPPDMPKREDFEDYTAEEDADADDLFSAAIDEYESELRGFEAALENDDCVHGLLVTDKDVREIRFTAGQQQTNQKNAPSSAKQFQQAIRDGAVTQAVLNAEIGRIKSKESRSKQIDQEKIQLEIHAQLFQQLAEPRQTGSLTAADQVAIRLLLFQSLDYNARYQVAGALSLDGENLDENRFFDTLALLSEAQVAYLTRIALAAKSESKRPDNITGWCLRVVGEQAGVDTKRIELVQQKVAGLREARVRQRLAELEDKREAMRQDNAA